MRLFQPNIEKMSRQGDVKGLVKALEDKDEKVVLASIDALRQIGCIPGIQAIVSRLGNSSPFRSGISNELQYKRYGHALAVCAGEQRANTLVELLKTNSSPDVLCCCVLALTELRAIDVLIEQLRTHPSDDVRRCCAMGLGELRAKEAVSVLCEAGLKDPKIDLGVIAKALNLIGTANHQTEETLLTIFDKLSLEREYHTFGGQHALADSILNPGQRTHAFALIATDLNPIEEISSALGKLGGALTLEHFRTELRDERPRVIETRDESRLIIDDPSTQKRKQDIRQALSEIKARLTQGRT